MSTQPDSWTEPFEIVSGEATHPDMHVPIAELAARPQMVPVGDETWASAFAAETPIDALRREVASLRDTVEGIQTRASGDFAVVDVRRPGLGGDVFKVSIRSEPLAIRLVELVARARQDALELEAESLVEASEEDDESPVELKLEE